MIPQLIFDWSRRTPDKTAVIWNGRVSLSYQSFANDIAVARGYFARRDCLGPGYAVLAVHNLLDFWVLSLAIRSLGLTTVVVGSVEQDQARHGVPSLRGIVEKLGRSNVRCVITTPHETEFWPGLDGLCSQLSLRLLSASLKDEGTFALGLEAFEARQPTGGHVMLTSATTGTQKMVLMSPTFDANALRRAVELFDISQESALSVFLFKPWMAIGYRAAASPWLVGGTTVIDQRPQTHRALLQPGITHAMLSPSVLSVILSAPANAFPRNEAMRLAVSGGAMTRTQAEDAKTRITPRLFNLYGSTETGGIAITSLDTPEDHRWHRIAHNRVVEIVDDLDRVVPTGEIGRLRISAAGGPVGYLNDEAATRAFFKDGFFYPGDQAVRRSDGRVALQGRLTDVIHVQGGKFNPAPFEERLCDLLGVRGVCLLSQQDDNGEEVIYLVIENPTTINSECVTDILKKEFLEFNQAHINIEYVTALPRNQMGKVLRQVVRGQFIARPPRDGRVDLVELPSSNTVAD
jgi:acyl-coenzyme A synthetase/AMP-(fatty) acid ligase